MYKHLIKRMIDIVLSGLALVILSPIVAILVRTKLGSPVIFKQDRPGYKGKTFKMYKFRTMLDPQTRDGRKLTDNERLECIENGIDVLTDEERLPKFGRILRAASLDGKVIIGTTTETIENKGFREVSPIHFFSGRDHFSDYRIEDYGYGEMLLLA